MLTVVFHYINMGAQMNDKISWLYVGAVATLIVLGVSLVEQSSVISEETYKYAVASQEVSINVYYALHHFIPLHILGLVLSLIMSLVLISIAYVFKKKPLNFAILVFLFSPAFLYTSFNASQTLFGFIVVASIWFASNMKKGHWLVYGLSLMLSTLDFAIAIMMAVLLVGISTFSNMKKHLRIAALISFIASFLWFFMFQRELLFSSVFDSLSLFMFEFGNIYGTSVLVFIVAIIGTIFFGEKYSPSLIIPGIVLFGLSLLFGNVLVFHLVLSVLAAPPLVRMIYKRWSIYLVKFASIFVLVLFLLLNMLTFYMSYREQQLDGELFSLFEMLEQLPDDSVILISDQKGYSAEYYTGITTFVKYDSRYNAEEIYFSTNAQNTRALLVQRGITHIVMSQELIDELWQGRFFGLRVLIHDTDFFELLYESEDYGVYAVR